MVFLLQKYFQQAFLEDFTYIFLKFYGAGRIIPDYTGYNTQRSKPCNVTNITYLSIIDASPTKYSGVYTTMKKGFENE